MAARAPTAATLALAVAAAAAGSSPFPGSLLIKDPSWGSTLNGWTNHTAGRKWALCYSSFTNSSHTPELFHQLCDQYDKTLIVVHNDAYHFEPGSPDTFGNATFGGFAAGTWGKAACCAKKTNVCDSAGGTCHDDTSASDFLFVLSPGLDSRPGPPARFGLKAGAAHDFQVIRTDEGSQYWPAWGTDTGLGNDLVLGENGDLVGGRCAPSTYTAPSSGSICGGAIWQGTQMEVWRLA